MSEPNPPRPETYADLQREKVCDRFEAQWKAGQRPRLEEFLPVAPADDDSALFAELLALELSYRADRGERPTREEYRDRFPRRHGAIAAAFDRFGSRPSHDAKGIVIEFSRSKDATHGRDSVDAHEEGPGSTVGPYKLLQRLGEGGMGTVYLAEQDHPVRRRVAIKVIKAGMDSRYVIARFEQERQALAMMDHPNIARVLDAGATEQGRPYFVMELVKGIPITRYCDQEHLTPRERLELFVPVCQAVQHAHQKGIIHRDLKPSNVLIALYDGRAVPKIIDFGVAKATHQKLTERTMFTEVGSLVGTLEYMAPEQAELNNLDVDTRADVYSLGVLLYELLAGSPPFTQEQLRGAAFVDMLRLIREVEPPKPSTRLSSSTELATIAAKRKLDPQRLSRLMRGDLDWITMKALEKDRNRRYETADGFAVDIQRYLADEAVQACPPSLAYRLRKFARRNRGGLFTAALVIATLLVGTAVSTWQAIRATNALEGQRRTSEVLDEQRNQINGKIGGTLLEIAALRERARNAGAESEQTWNELHDAARRAETLASSDLADQALTDRVRGLLKQVSQDEKDRNMTVRLSELRLENLAIAPGTRPLRDVGRSFAEAFREYGLPVTELSPVEAAGRVRRSRIREDLLAGLDAWSAWDVQTTGFAWKDLIAVAQSADDHAWRRKCRDAAVREDRNALLVLARQEDSPRQPAEAVLLLAVFLVAQSNGQAVPEDRLSVVSGLLDKASVWHSADARFGFALAAWIPGKVRVVDNQAVLRLSIERLKSDGASAKVLATAYFNLGQLLVQQQDTAGAVVACREAARLVPDRKDYREMLIRCVTNDDEKIAECTEWIQFDPTNPFPYAERAGIYWRRQQWAETLADYIVLTRLRPLDAQHWSRRASAHSSLREYPEALAAATEAIEAAQRAGENPAFYWHLRAGVYQYLQKWDLAISDSTRAVELNPTEAIYWGSRGDAYRWKGDFQQALEDYDLAVKNESADRPGIGLERRARLNEELGRWDQACSDWNRYLQLRPNNYARDMLFRLLVECPEPSIRDPRRAIEMDKENGPRIAYAPHERSRLIGEAHFQLGEWEDAVAELTKAADHRPDVGFHVAIAHWHVGHHNESEEWLVRTAKWAETKQTNAQLLASWAEARKLITGRNEQE